MQKQDLKINKIIISLIYHKWQQYFSEDTKTLATKKKKDKSTIMEKKKFNDIAIYKEG